MLRIKKGDEKEEGEGAEVNILSQTTTPEGG